MTKAKWTRLLLLLILLFCLGTLVIFVGIKKLEKSIFPKKYEYLVETYAEQAGLDPLLVYAVIRTESSFQPTACSGVDARGLMQITEETFQWIKSKIAQEEQISFEDLYDPELNIRFGTYYLGRCMERYDDHVGTAAAAYHSGWGTVDKLLKSSDYSEDGQTLHTYPFQQMGRYVWKIDHAYKRYQKIYANNEKEG